MDFSQIPSPCFVLEESRLRKNLEILKQVQVASGARILLALKGFALPAAFDLIRQYLPGTTASSLNEARLGREYFGGEVHACAPVYLENEIKPLLDMVSHITFNSIHQWEKYRDQLDTNRVSAALRVNPEHSEVKTDLYNPGTPGSRLGIPAAELNGCLPEGIDGLHIHVLCESGSDALERVVATLEKQASSLLHQARWLNLGGGHLITHEGYDTVKLIELLNYLRSQYKLEVILEPGAAVVWKTGVLVAEIEDCVVHRGIRTAMLNVSFAAHMPDCLEMPYKPQVRGARDPLCGEEGWRLGGLTCLAGDFTGDYVFDKDPKPGDRIVFEDMMHYTMVKSTLFNGVAHPSIGIWKENGIFECIRKFSFEDYLRRIG